MHYMLTDHFFMLSKPGHPRKVCTAKIVKRYFITISGVRTRSGRGETYIGQRANLYRFHIVTYIASLRDLYRFAR